MLIANVWEILKNVLSHISFILNVLSENGIIVLWMDLFF